MKKNIIISSIVASILVTWMLWYSASADDSDFGDKFERGQFELSSDFKKGHNWGMKGLTAEEKTSVENMTNEEKTAFMEAKKAEKTAEKEAKKVERAAHENVIDKLLAWDSLTSEEEAVRAEIITKRAERKIEKEAKQAEMEEIKTIFEKKKVWEDLTDEETTKLNEFKGSFKAKGGKSGKWGNKGHGKNMR